MSTIKLEIDDSKVDIVLNIIKNLKSGVIKKYELIRNDKTQKDFMEASQESLEKVWDNNEDSLYDRYLEV
jgi:hypothetical protein